MFENALILGFFVSKVRTIFRRLDKSITYFIFFSFKLFDLGLRQLKPFLLTFTSPKTKDYFRIHTKCHESGILPEIIQCSLMRTNIEILHLIKIQIGYLLFAHVPRAR
jgi:hypothetical protein